MESYKLNNLYNTISTDLEIYTKALNEMSHMQLKQREYGIEISAADAELLDRLGELVEALQSVKNQAKEMIK